MPENWSTSIALQETAEQFHILVDSVEEYAIYLLDPNGNVVTWNTGAQKIKGYTAEEIIGKKLPPSIWRTTLPLTSRNVICVKQRGWDIFVIRACASAKTDQPLKPKLY